MRLVIFTILILILLLSVIPVSGQRSNSNSEITTENLQPYLKPGLQDTFTFKSPELNQKLDSMKIDRYLHKRPFPGNPFLGRRHFNDDNMVYNPGPSFDRMPNADVTTPGIHYTLKIVPPGGYFPKQ